MLWSILEILMLKRLANFIMIFAHRVPIHYKFYLTISSFIMNNQILSKE